MYSPRFSISTWTLHGQMNPVNPGGSPEGEARQRQVLLDLPTRIAELGIRTLEICHFHLASTESGYLAELRAALRAADMELFSLLIDTGDITAPSPTEREGHRNTIRHWIEVAAKLGAKNVRIDAGRQPPTPQAIELSAGNLRGLASYAETLGVGTFTENWHETSARPRPLLEILNRCGGHVGLCVDTGNAEGPERFNTLALLMPRATSMHFHFRPMDPTNPAQSPVDSEDMERVVALMRKAEFSGPVSLIYSGTENEWGVVERLKNALEPYMRQESPLPPGREASLERGFAAGGTFSPAGCPPDREGRGVGGPTNG